MAGTRQVWALSSWWTGTELNQKLESSLSVAGAAVNCGGQTEGELWGGMCYFKEEDYEGDRWRWAREPSHRLGEASGNSLGSQRRHSTGKGPAVGCAGRFRDRKEASEAGLSEG